ncbi:MAG: NCS2 family permease [Planctomycetota bacterium]
MDAKHRYPWFVKGDLDGFFGLAVDNLVQVLVIVGLCTKLCGFTDEIIFVRILPGVAVSLLVGNIFYALLARWVARRDGNTTCTALPYGINTPSVFAYIFFILAPVYHLYKPTLGDEGAGLLAWKIGLLACIGSGIIEFLGAFIGGWVRRVTPRAALLSALAAIGIMFIASPFAFQIFERPLVAIVPMFIVLIGYFAKVRFPRGLPSGFVAVIVGTILAWTIPQFIDPGMMDGGAVKGILSAMFGEPRTFFSENYHLPTFFGSEVLGVLQSNKPLLLSFLGVILPMGLINAIGSLQNIESAEAAGDRFNTGACMAVNGLGTIAAGLFGSCFPTTIYIGHPGWKALGARSGYSIINGLFFTLIFVFGLSKLFVAVIPMEAGIAIVMWIGIIITAQSYEAVPKRHYAAVAIAFFPAVAAIALFYVPQILAGTGAATGILPMVAEHNRLIETVHTDGWWPVGIYALAGANGGYIITCIIISAVSAFLIDRKFKTAAIWCVFATVVTLLGFQHAFRVEPDPAIAAAPQAAVAQLAEQPTSPEGDVEAERVVDAEITAEAEAPKLITSAPRELLVWQRSEDAFKDTSLYLEKTDGAFWHRGYRIAAAYLVAAALLFVIHSMRRKGRAFEDIVVDGHAAQPTAAVPRRAPPTAEEPARAPLIESEPGSPDAETTT